MGKNTHPDLLVGHLQERSKELLDCANRHLPGREPARRTVLHFATRACDGALQDTSTNLRESREVQQFAECALTVLGKEFPAAEFVYGSPCSHDFLHEPDMLRTTGSPGRYEIIVPRGSCRFEHVDVVSVPTPEEMRLMRERVEGPQPKFSIGQPVLSELCVRDDIERVLRSERDRLMRCYETDEQRKPSFTSGLVASFDVDPDGRVASVEISMTDDEEIGECVEQVLRRSRFARQQGECHGKLFFQFVADP